MYVILNFKRDQFIEPQSKHSFKVKVFTITVKLLCVSAFHTSQLAPLNTFRSNVHSFWKMWLRNVCKDRKARSQNVPRGSTRKENQVCVPV